MSDFFHFKNNFGFFRLKLKINDINNSHNLPLPLATPRRHSNILKTRRRIVNLTSDSQNRQQQQQLQKTQRRKLARKMSMLITQSARHFERPSVVQVSIRKSKMMSRKSLQLLQFRLLHERQQEPRWELLKRQIQYLQPLMCL